MNSFPRTLLLWLREGGVKWYRKLHRNYNKPLPLKREEVWGWVHEQIADRLKDMIKEYYQKKSNASVCLKQAKRIQFILAFL
jgi:hypothetical protein